MELADNPLVENNQTDSRILFIDIAKFIGIFFIYLGHLGANAGVFYEFAFSFHVPLFFFLSGCTERISRPRTVIKYFTSRIKSILIPWLFFAVLSIIITYLSEGYGLSAIKTYILQLLKGTIRNGFTPAGGIWFLSRLFVMSILFYWIKKLRFPILILAVSCGLHIISQTLLPNNPIIKPSLFWNVDSALYYIIYYAIGYVSFPLINNLILKNKIITVLTGGITFIYTALFLFGKNLLSFLFGFNLFSDILLSLLQRLLLIMFWIIVSYALQKLSLLRKIGENTLYLCGSESVVKIIFSDILSLFGIFINLSTPLSSIIYVFLLLYLTNRFIVPLEKKVIDKIKNYIFDFPKNICNKKLKEHC